jgi:hypothetical protein
MPYYRKTALVFAEQFLPNENQIPEGVEAKHYSWHDAYVLETLEGTHELRDGDYVCTGVKGERWNVAKEIFEATYEKVSDTDGKV